MSNLELLPGTMNFTIGNGLAIFKGSTWNVPVTIGCVEGENIVPANIEGFTGRCQIRTKAEALEVIATPIVVIEDAKQGIFSLNLTDEETLAIATAGETYDDSTEFQYDVYFDREDGKAYRVLQGFVEVSPNITEA